MRMDDISRFNPFDPEHLSAPAEGYALMRRDAPLFRLDLPSPAPVFIATRKADIEAIARDTETFSSNPVPSVWRWGEFDPEIAEIFAESGYKVVQTLQASDPPQSLVYRKIAEQALNRKKVTDLAPEIDRIIDRLMAAIPDNEPVNFVDAFSVPLPLEVICLILGMPYKDAAFLKYYSDEFTHLVDPVHPLPRAIEATRTIVKGYRYFAEMIERLQRMPEDNLTSAIANAEVDGKPLTMEERLSMVHVLIIAGNETTRNALSSAMFVLATRPDIWATIQTEPDRIADFVEEVLRIHAPAVTTPRTVMKDTVLHGVELPKGSTIFLMWASGGQDESTFDAPMTFDMDRKNKRAHITFGMGVHHCIGSFLARAELIAAIKRWTEEFEGVSLAVPADQVRYDPIFGFHALSNLPVKITRKQR
ncbi:cytochrome P450 (plasmid) [Sphingobium sp. SJ10-10]|uniref:cytochrome P450 n=1 Tax=Sphingobium sp. SJ10-10 TaxID=3114999 RepID=UPI002E17EF42|nr:cytochrome P450 [Sphingobium sp. SJ10-10]